MDRTPTFALLSMFPTHSQPQQRRDHSGLLLTLLAILRCRFEIAYILSMFAIYFTVAHFTSALGGMLATWAVGILLLVEPHARKVLIGTIYTAEQRRRFARAVMDSGAHSRPSINSHRAYSLIGPRVSKAEHVPTGDRLHVRIPRGSSIAELERVKDNLAVCLHAREVRILQDPDSDASRCTIDVIREDPFANAAKLPWPHEDAEQLSIWDDVDLGHSEDGEEIRVNLFETAWLVGGTIGSGKSVFINQIVAHAALSPDCELWLLDGKDIEFPRWAGAARIYVGRDRQAAIVALRELEDTMQARYRELKARGDLKVKRGDTLHILVVDELAEYLTYDNDDEYMQAGAILELLRSITSLGRAAGLVPVFSTQRPSHDIVNTKLRDLPTHRVALMCMTTSASDMILGDGDWSAYGVDASRIRGGRGVGFLRVEGSVPKRFRGHYLDDELVAKIASKASSVRTDAWLRDAGMTEGLSSKEEEEEEQ